MRRTPLAGFVVFLVGLLGACNQKPEPSERVVAPSEQHPATAAPVGADTTAVGVVGADETTVPIEDDYIEQAQKQITQENLEAQLDALEEEIGGPD